MRSHSAEHELKYLQEGPELLDDVPVGTVAAPRTIDFTLDKARLLQDLEVLGNRRGRKRDLVRQLSGDADVLLQENPEDSHARRVSKRPAKVRQPLLRICARDDRQCLRVWRAAIVRVGSLALDVESLPAGFDAIPADRKRMLDKLALFVRTRRDSGETARVLYICTHNSRRSHMGQIFSTVAAAYYGVDRVETFSGGTEATAFNPRAVDLGIAGF